MDLEHVCVVHRRWFRNLRIHVQRPDYVEYELTGLFYGLKQEVLARGGPVDEDHYWYEFVTALARMRVDGTLEGDDGHLTQEEIITFSFSPLLGPMFWLLRPLFIRQKQDILQADTALLEEEYRLDQTGFQRTEFSGMRVVVYGGNGFFGRIVVEELLARTTARIDIASRSAKIVAFAGGDLRVRFVQSDLWNRESVSTTIHGADLVIVAAGPFQGMPLIVLEECIAQGIPYIDVADDCDYVRRAYARLASRPAPPGMVVLIGCSVVPGLTTLLTRFAQSRVPKISQTRICISPGTRHPRGAGSFACLLSTVGREFEVPLDGSTRKVVGWTEPVRVTFPMPMGDRTCYRVVDIADHFIQPLYFGTETVEFRIGSELSLLNLLLSAVRSIRRFPSVPVEWLIPPSRVMIQIASFFGTSAGGVMVHVTGYGGEERRSETWSVFSSEGGQRIPSLVPAIAAEMVLNGEIKGQGIVPLPDWIHQERLVEELSARGVQVAVRQGSGWQSVGIR